MRSDDLRVQSPAGLLVTYASVLHLLHSHGVVRSFNSPVGDIAEWIVSKKLNLTLAGKSAKSYDATDPTGRTYQIKGRWLAGKNRSRQLGAIRNLSSDPFDFLAAVMFDGDFQVEYAAVIPVQVVREKSKYVQHSNSWRFSFTKSLLSSPGVQDITELLQQFPPTEQEARMLAAWQAARLDEN